jgi:serine/threonine-protein kinase RsbW
VKGALRPYIHEEDAPETFRRWNEAIVSGTPFEAELRLRRASDNSYRWFLSRAVPVREAHGTARWIGAMTDIDAQKRASENFEFVIQATDLFYAADSVEEACNRFATLAVQRFADWCFVVLTHPVQRFTLAATAHRDPELVRYVRSYLDEYPVGQDERLAALLQAHRPALFPVISDDMLRAAARDEKHLALLRTMQLHSAIVAPLTHGGELMGGIMMYSAQSLREFTDDDANVLQMLAHRAAARIQTLRTLREERRRGRRLQFLGHATEAVYESFDSAAAFGNLARIIVSEIADMAAVFRLEQGGAVRVVGAAHREPGADDIARSLVGIRVMHPEAEKRFVDALHGRRPLIGRRLAEGSLQKSVWPYLSDEIATLAPKELVTIPLHSRGRIYGALVAYYVQDGRRIRGEEVDLLVEIGRHASVAMENADVFERERRMSETLQDSLLPPSLPQLEGIAFDAVYLPSATEAQVGGDWYDAFDLGDGTIVVSAGDVTGQGAKAAVVMGKVRNLLAIAPCYERDPARILDTVESVLARRYSEVIVTAFLGFIDTKRRTISYANAGHPPPLLRTSNGVEELLADGLPIGLRREAAQSSSRTADLRDARLLVLYTDGLTESGRDVIAGNRQLHDVVQRDAVLHTHHPARFIEETCLPAAASDDVAVLTISFENTMRWSFDAENAKAAQDARGEFVAYLRKHAGDAEEIETAELVFGELVGNVVRHAPGAIDIDVEWVDGSPKLHVLDRGPAFHIPSHLPRDPLSEDGRGLYIVRELSKSMRVEHVPGYGNHVCVELPVRAKDE